MPGICARCCRNVYFAEQRVALGRVWHVFCFSCYCCRKLLDSCTVVPHCSELYCKPCHARLFSSGGKRYQVTGQSSLTNCTGDGQQCSAQPCAACPPCAQAAACSQCFSQPCSCPNSCDTVKAGIPLCCNDGCGKQRPNAQQRSSAAYHSPGCSRSCSPSPACLDKSNSPCQHHLNNDRACQLSNSPSDESEIANYCPVVPQLCTPLTCDAPASRETAAYYNRQHNANKSTSLCACGGSIGCPSESREIYLPCEACCDSQDFSTPPCERSCGQSSGIKSANCHRSPNSHCARSQNAAQAQMHACPNPACQGLSKAPQHNNNNSFGGGATCRRCQKPVYPAEQMSAAGGYYHTCCFSCFCCRQPLEVRSFVEGGGEIHCRPCWNSFCSQNECYRLQAVTNSYNVLPNDSQPRYQSVHKRDPHKNKVQHLSRRDEMNNQKGSTSAYSRIKSPTSQCSASASGGGKKNCSPHCKGHSHDTCCRATKYTSCDHGLDIYQNCGRCCSAGDNLKSATSHSSLDRDPNKQCFRYKKGIRSANPQYSCKNRLHK